MERPKTSSPVNSGFNGEMMMINHQNVIKNNMQYMYIYIYVIIHQTVAVMNFFFMKYDKYDDQVA